MAMDSAELPEKFRLTEKLSFEAFKSASEIEVARRRDPDLYKFVENLFYHPLFKSVMISSITLNAIFLVLETDYKVRYESHLFLQVADLIILAIYTTEFLMYLYLDPVNYWKDGYKRFDAAVLLLAYLPYTIDHSNPKRHHVVTMLKGFQALRVLKLLYYSPGITVDGWTDLQEELDDKKFVTSRTFTIIFILLGFFVFFNMFIGVVIMDIQNSTEQYERKLKEERRITLIAKKQAILKRQQEEIYELFNLQKSTEYKTFDEMVESFKKSLLHSDPIVLEDFCASLPFIDLYLASLDRQDATVYRLQDLYYEMVAILTTLLYHSQEKALQSLQYSKRKSK
ncbi:cation channel sperm-associated protein 3 isoform X3 [Crotalus tigris]|uniref:cation channel sperm-associated protein 3 isoform X3 n=1 Tax=Crotalus tigris TaxID=88082 RepID=UPI00192F29EC|nr:cation channel sperm-associated protein 3 isoform X3 [Crotalus tigris]